MAGNPNCTTCYGRGLIGKPYRTTQGHPASRDILCPTCSDPKTNPARKPEPMTDQQTGNQVTPYSTPADLVQQRRDHFAPLLPSHVNADQWIRLAATALRKDPKLAQAASTTPASLMGALSDAARLGLEPGTEEFYLTPRKRKGMLEVLGIVGYQGIIELIYRAGAVSSVIAEVVYTNDRFEYQPGRHERPLHEIDWDAADRGTLRLVYAYAIMRDGATSKVVVMNRAKIEQVKKSSQGADSEYSPWNQHPEAMWLKSACRQLGKWVPTSAEYRREQIRAVQQVATERPASVDVTTFGDGTMLSHETVDRLDQDERVDTTTGEILDAELEPEDGVWPTVAEPGNSGQA